MAGVKALLEQQVFFSHELDITRRLQSRLESEKRDVSSNARDFFSEADPRYVWNTRIAGPLLRQGISPRWLTPVVQGFVQARPCPCPDKRASRLLLLLMARRGWRRAGTCFHARGLDDDGEAGSWVETEQLVRVKGTPANASEVVGWLSLTQIRGSAPLFWEQTSGMEAARVEATRSAELTCLGIERHDRQLREEYGDVMYVNLLSDSHGKKETEGVLLTSLGEQQALRPSLTVKHLDFHANVRGVMSRPDCNFTDDLTKLVADVLPQIQRMGYLDATEDAATSCCVQAAPRRRQQGVLRTNCFDCLDRSNAFQYQVAWEWLYDYCAAQPGLRAFIESGTSPTATGGGYPSAALASMVSVASSVGVNDAALSGLWGSFTNEGAAASAEDHTSALQLLLQSMWADLGDVLSLQVMGTASTMGSALRQGKRNSLGFVHKGWTAVNRAIKGRFGDEARQAALELLLGKHRLPRAPGPPEIRRSPCGHQLVMAVVTWNLHGQACWEIPGALEALIRGMAKNTDSDARPVDVVGFCFQEIVELTPANVMKPNGGAERHVSFERAAPAALLKVLGERFVRVNSVGLVGLYS